MTEASDFVMFCVHSSIGTGVHTNAIELKNVFINNILISCFYSGVGSDFHTDIASILFLLPAPGRDMLD